MTVDYGIYTTQWKKKLLGNRARQAVQILFLMMQPLKRS